LRRAASSIKFESVQTDTVSPETVFRAVNVNGKALVPKDAMVARLIRKGVGNRG
jgi:hypothetical protein